MRFTIAWLIVLFAIAASDDPVSSSDDSISSSDYPEEKSDSKSEDATEPIVIKPTSENSASTNDDSQKNTQNEQLKNNDENDPAPEKYMTAQLLVQIERDTDEEGKKIEERNKKNSISSDAEKNDKARENENSPENPIESKISKDFIDIRRQRQETNSEDERKNSSPDVQFDDSKTRVASDPPQRFSQRSRKFSQKVQDDVPFLLLTQGGYKRPFMRSLSERYTIRPDSSEQSENIQKPDRTVASTKRRPDTRRIVPQVTYSPSPESPYVFGPGPFMNPAFDASARNAMSMNQILPSTEQNTLLNHPSTEFTSYSTSSFQPQSSSNNDIGSFPSFRRDLNNVGMYQTLSSSPFQTPEIVYQNSPQVQQQPVIIDAGRNIPSQFQHNPLAMHPGFQTMEVSPSPNYAALFRNPAVNTPFEIPSNFYGNTPNANNPFNNPPISFLSQYPNFHNRGPSQLYQYPVTTGTQIYQPSSNNKQFDADTSQDENKAKETIQKADEPVSRDDSLQAQLGAAGLQAENAADVYMRYPTVEAGYAIEENLPTQNNSEESSSGSKQANDRHTNIPNNPYRNILNSALYNQKINNSFVVPPEIFRSVPIDFVYQRPGGIFTQYPERNGGISNYPNRNFESRIPFNTISSLPESFLSTNNQHPARQESNETPSCAKENNASVCFEDKEYPKSDILYFINSNAFLTDRLLSPELSLKAFAFVERNGNKTEQNEENYACDVATNYGMPLRAKNLDGMWRIIVNLEGRFSQPVRMEVCKTLGSSCSYADSQVKTSCVQKHSFQRLLTWSPFRGIYSEVYKIPVACSCQIIKNVEI